MVTCVIVTDVLGITLFTSGHHHYYVIFTYAYMSDIVDGGASLKAGSSHSANNYCHWWHYDNLRWHQWRQSWHHNSSWVSVLWVCMRFFFFVFLMDGKMSATTNRKSYTCNVLTWKHTAPETWLIHVIRQQLWPILLRKLNQVLMNRYWKLLLA